jgi:hypothetical protein
MAHTERQKQATERAVEEARDRHDRNWTRAVREEERDLREANAQAEQYRNAFRIVP